MEDLNHKHKFIIESHTKGTHFGILVITTAENYKLQGNLSYFYVDNNGFTLPWEKEFFSIEVYQEISEVLIEKARAICEEHGVLLMTY